VIISIYVSIFTAFINLFVDFLFVDILFAPMMPSTQQEKISQSLFSPKASQVREVEVPKTTQGRSASISKLDQVKRMTLLAIQTGNLELETTRVLPSSTLQAHEIAKLSVNEIIDDRVSVIKKTVLRHETQRRTSLLRARSKAIFKRNTFDFNEMDVNEQFVDLSVDIAEQRKELKRSQQEKFDEMWG
jgi:hypothetical protein